MKKIWDQEKMNKYSPANVLRWRIFDDYAPAGGIRSGVIAIFDESSDGFLTVGTYDSHEEAVAEIDRLDSLNDEKGGTMLEWKDDGHGGRYAEVFGELFCVCGINEPSGKRWFYGFGKFAPSKEIFNIRDMDHAIEVAVADFKNQFSEMREQVCKHLENTEQLLSAIFQHL